MAKTDISVAEALKQAHVALLGDLRKLDELVRTCAREGLAELIARLAETRRHVAEHFRFEEQNGGFMPAVMECQPRLERLLRQFADEHRELLRCLDALIIETKAANSLNDALRDDVRRWVGRVRQHEARENELLQDAFNLDIGAAD